MIQEANISRKERYFNQKSGQMGEKEDSCSVTNFKDIAQPPQFSKGKGGRGISVNHWGKKLGSASFFIVCKLTYLFFRWYFAWVICRFAKEAVKEEN